jgi:hypothetical protein
MPVVGSSGIADRRVGKCSGGEQQRLRFAMSLVSDPELLILDDAGPVQRLVDRPRPHEQARRAFRGLPDGEVLEQPAGLHHRRDEPARDGRPRLHPVHLGRACGGVGQPQDDVDGRGLPRAVGPEERDNFPGRDVQVDVLHRLDRAEILAHAAQRDRGRQAAPGGRPPPLVRHGRYCHAAIVAPAPAAPKSSVSRRAHDNCHGPAAAGAGVLS